MCNGCGALMRLVFVHPNSGKGICRVCAHEETGRALVGPANIQGQELVVQGVEVMTR